MKIIMRTRLFFTAFVLFFVSNFSFASFPVNKNNSSEHNIASSKETTKELVREYEIKSDFNHAPTNIAVNTPHSYKILSLSFIGASIMCSLLGILLTTHTIAGSVLLMLGILSLIPAIIFWILYIAL